MSPVQHNIIIISIHHNHIIVMVSVLWDFEVYSHQLSMVDIAQSRKKQIAVYQSLNIQ